LFQFHFHRRQIRVGALFEEAGLLHRPVLGPKTETPALVHRQLMGELVDLGLVPGDFLIFLADQLALAGHLRCQPLHQQAQFIRSQVFQLGGNRHGNHDANRALPWPLGMSTIAGSYRTRMMPPSPIRSHGRPSTKASNCPRESVAVVSPAGQRKRP